MNDLPTETSGHPASTDREWDAPEIIAEEPMSNALLYPAGLGVLLLNRVRYALLGYRNARPFAASEFGQAIGYDLKVVAQWLRFLQIYSGDQVTIQGKNILELGPGADLGVGLSILAQGANSYNALDVNDLASNVPQEFYSSLFSRFRQEGLSEESIAELQSQLDRTHAGKNDRLNYVVNDDFDINVFSNREIDLVLSQAAFEHFDDIGDTLQSLSRNVRTGCVLVAEVDLSTHTRWFRDHDPLNIYRYGKSLYQALRFRGAPNRVPASEYVRILQEAGWHDVVASPLRVVGNAYLEKIRPSLQRPYQDLDAEAGYLSICLCATKT